MRRFVESFQGNSDCELYSFSRIFHEADVEEESSSEREQREDDRNTIWSASHKFERLPKIYELMRIIVE